MQTPGFSPPAPAPAKKTPAPAENMWNVGHRDVKKCNTNAIVIFQLLLKDLSCWQSYYCVATLRLLKFSDKIRTCSIVLQTPQLYINTNTIIIIYMFVTSRIIKREYLFFVDGLKFFRWSTIIVCSTNKCSVVAPAIPRRRGYVSRWGGHAKIFMVMRVTYIKK